MSEKDYSLLRPFDLDAAKRGEEICVPGGKPRLFLTVSSRGHVVVVDSETGYVCSYLQDAIRMAPLAWVEGKPVYKWDALNWVSGSVCWKVVAQDAGLQFDDGSVRAYDSIAEDEGFTWQPPKVKRTVKMLGYRDDATGKLALLEEYPAPPLGLTRDESLDREIEVEA